MLRLPDGGGVPAEALERDLLDRIPAVRGPGAEASVRRFDHGAVGGVRKRSRVGPWTGACGSAEQAPRLGGIGGVVGVPVLVEIGEGGQSQASLGQGAGLVEAD